MKVVVLGKEHVSGTSKKNGKSFEANVVHVAYKKIGVDGQSVDSIWLNPNDYPLTGIQVGKSYNVDRDSRGFLLSFDLA